MFNLIKKDLIVQKKTLFFIIPYFLFSLITFDNMSPNAFISLMTITSVFILSTASFSYDEKNKSTILFSSLPITKLNIVLAKYINTIVYSIISFTLVTIIMIISNINNLNFLSALNIILFIKLTSVSMLIASITFPLFHKYGFIKTKSIIFIIYFILFGIITNLFQNNNFYIGYFINSILIPNMLIILLIILLFFISSILISLKIYENKNLY
ncbi:ABC-2 transporter permease [Clostridium rectalis]|uniref:ABC-2 transporter permease n=1 Tax=Clostridium rectalis TaxID=2040295 RepID=UPI000F640D66